MIIINSGKDFTGLYTLMIPVFRPSDQKFIERYFSQIKAMGHYSFWIGISGK